MNFQKNMEDARNQVQRAHAQLNQAKVAPDPSLSKRLGTLLDQIDAMTSPLIPESMLTAGTLARVNVAVNLAIKYTAFLDFLGLREQAVSQMGRLQIVKHPKTGEDMLWLPGETPEHILEQIEVIYHELHEDAASHLTDPENTTGYELFQDVIFMWHTNHGGSLGAWLNEQGERPHGLAHLYLHWQAWRAAKNTPVEISPIELDENFKPMSLTLNGIELSGYDMTPAEPLPNSEAPRRKDDE